jgi:hypothetical protein
MPKTDREVGIRGSRSHSLRPRRPRLPRREGPLSRNSCAPNGRFLRFAPAGEPARSTVDAQGKLLLTKRLAPQCPRLLVVLRCAWLTCRETNRLIAPGRYVVWIVAEALRRRTGGVVAKPARWLRARFSSGNRDRNCRSCEDDGCSHDLHFVARRLVSRFPKFAGSRWRPRSEFRNHSDTRRN